MTVANYWAIVPAAGTGQRFGAEVAKQFQRLGDHLVAQHSLSRLLKTPCITKIIVPCDMTSPYWPQIPAASDSRVELVAGGAERVHSVLQGLLGHAASCQPPESRRRGWHYYHRCSEYPAWPSKRPAL